MIAVGRKTIIRHKYHLHWTQSRGGHCKNYRPFVQLTRPKMEGQITSAVLLRGDVTVIIITRPSASIARGVALRRLPETHSGD